MENDQLSAMIASLWPCSGGVTFLDGFDDPNDAWHACENAGWMNWLLDALYRPERWLNEHSNQAGYVTGWYCWTDAELGLYNSHNIRPWTADEIREVCPDWPL